MLSIVARLKTQSSRLKTLHKRIRAQGISLKGRRAEGKAKVKRGEILGVRVSLVPCDDGGFELAIVQKRGEIGRYKLVVSN